MILESRVGVCESVHVNESHLIKEQGGFRNPLPEHA